MSGCATVSDGCITHVCVLITYRHCELHGWICVLAVKRGNLFICYCSFVSFTFCLDTKSNQKVKNG